MPKHLKDDGTEVVLTDNDVDLIGYLDMVGAGFVNGLKRGWVQRLVDASLAKRFTDEGEPRRVRLTEEGKRAAWNLEVGRWAQKPK